mgnify:CR=1 FL=1
MINERVDQKKVFFFKLFCIKKNKLEPNIETSLQILIYMLDTVWGQKKQPKVNECSSVANYRTAMIFFLQSSQYSYVFFDGNFFCQEFVCLPFFCHFSPLEGPKRAQKHPDFRYEAM